MTVRILIIQMKSRTKSTKASLSVESKKSKPKLNQSKLAKSVNKSTIKANLQSTLRLLESRLNLRPSTNPTLLSLSSSIYKIVQEHIPEKPKASAGPTLHSFNNSGAQITKERQTVREPIPKRSSSNHSSSLMQYFKDKFGSPATDEQAVERKLKALQVLKRSQELVSRCSSNYNSSLQSGADLGCDIGGKEVVISKIKEKKKHN